VNTDQARRIVALHDDADRALANLRNAAAMATDDPRAPELLERAGDAYAEAITELDSAQTAIVLRHGVDERDLFGAEDRARQALAGVSQVPAQPSRSAPGAEDPQPASGQVQPEAERGTPAEVRETVPVPRPEAPADAPPAPETDGDGSGEGQAAAKD
jgi:hypothetical protein